MIILVSTLLAITRSLMKGKALHATKEFSRCRICLNHRDVKEDGVAWYFSGRKLRNGNKIASEERDYFKRSAVVGVALCKIFS